MRLYENGDGYFVIDKDKLMEYENLKNFLNTCIDNYYFEYFRC